jgi:hypothetical protein
MVASDQEQFGAVHHCSQKMMPAGEFLLEFGNRVNGGVEVAANHFLGGAERRHHFAKSGIPDCEYVHVAIRALLSPRERTIHERQR